MVPIAELSSDAARRIDFVLTDIDDTITIGGKLPAAAYRALWDLYDSGINVIPVTGRPAGWCDLISRQWPVAAVIGENGACAFLMDGEHQVIVRHPMAPEPGASRERLERIASEAYRAVPGCRAAKDQFSRVYDIAVDFREEPPLLGYDDADRIREVFQAAGAHAKVSSIHVNAWFGDYDKRSMAAYLLGEWFDLDINDHGANERVLYCGDSPNDEPMFARFAVSVGVANIVDFASVLRSLPVFVTRERSADGFCEAIAHLLALRRKNDSNGLDDPR